MPTAIITISKIWEPGDGKTNFNIVSENGDKYSTKPEYMGEVNEGETYQVNYLDKQFNGRPFRQVIGIVPSFMAPPAAASPPRARPAVSHYPGTNRIPATPKSPYYPGDATGGPTPKDITIATLAIAKGFIERGDVIMDKDAIRQLLDKCYSAVEQSRIGNPQKKLDPEDPEFSDEIPM